MTAHPYAELEALIAAHAEAQREHTAASRACEAAMAARAAAERDVWETMNRIGDWQRAAVERASRPVLQAPCDGPGDTERFKGIWSAVSIGIAKP